MQGLYIHIPFCKKACHYCDFHFSTSLKLKDDLLRALKSEIILQKNYLPSATLHSIYLGGGTPSLLETAELEGIFEAIYSVFTVEAGAEITLEANPDDITAEKVAALKQAGINRLSIGIQSFFAEDLAWMNRAHTAYQAEHCIDIAQQAGIENITADLIYGYALLSDEKWIKNVERLFLSGINHLSAYSLTIEPKTALAAKIKKGLEPTPQSEHAARQFELLVDAIEANGWEQYEISNYCKNGQYAVHNTNYWKNQAYLGIGPSAHSFNGQTRQWNVANNAAYIAALNAGTLAAEIETLSVENRFNEYVMTGLRTRWGIGIAQTQKQFGNAYALYLMQQIPPFVQKGYLVFDNDTITLTRSGKLVADYIASELFFME